MVLLFAEEGVAVRSSSSRPTSEDVQGKVIENAGGEGMGGEGGGEKRKQIVRICPAK